MTALGKEQNGSGPCSDQESQSGRQRERRTSERESNVKVLLSLQELYAYDDLDQADQK